MKKVFIFFGMFIGLAFVCSTFAASITFEQIADTHTFIPEGTGTFTSLSGPYIHNGKIVFRGYGSDDQRGVYSDLDGTLQVVADSATGIPNGHGTFTGFGSPSAPGHNIFQYLAYNSPCINDSQIAFLGTGENGQAGIYLYKDGHLRVVANNDKDFSKFDGPYLSNSHVMFRAFNKKNQEGLYQANQKVSVLYNTQTKIPNGTGTFSKLWNPSFSDGFTAFRGDGSNGQEGVYANISGKLKMVANKNTKIPHQKNKFVGFGGPSIQGQALAFRGEGKDGHGIYLYSKNKLSTVVDLKTTIPNGKGLFTGLYNPTYDHGNVSFLGSGNNHQAGIYAWYQGKIIKIITNNDLLDGKKIKMLDMGAVSLSKNQIAFHIIFEDGSNGIYLATID